VGDSCRGQAAAAAARAGSGGGGELRSQRTYGDEKVANREIRVWHFVIERGP
jgi:hypothetical protein